MKKRGGILKTVRKNAEQIKKEIIDFLFEGPKGIKEIAEKIGSNWPTTNSYLEKLKETNSVNEVLVTDKMKVYRRTDDPVYYSIPFSKEIRTKTLYILREIKREWKKEKNAELSKTALQKLAVDVIKSCELNLPILEFHYGMTTCASLDSNNQNILELIETPKEKVEILNCIKNVVKDPKHTGFAYEERAYQYKRYEMSFYSSKETLSKLFLSHKKSGNTDDKINQKIQKALLNLSLNYPLKLEKFYLDFEKFIANAQMILLDQKKEESQKLEIIKSTLEQFWDKLTTFTSFKDSESFIEHKDKKLFEQIQELNLNFKEMSYKRYIEELESIAQEMDPFKVNMPEGSSSTEIQKLILEGLENE